MKLNRYEIETDYVNSFDYTIDIPDDVSGKSLKENFAMSGIGLKIGVKIFL
ncbi:MAG: hypothetical protein U9N51_09710 [Bacteroidota bacterium]|nr:hypothetical protein [Bacteroidota bacterium]